MLPLTLTASTRLTQRRRNEPGEKRAAPGQRDANEHLNPDWGLEGDCDKQYEDSKPGDGSSSDQTPKCPANFRSHCRVISLLGHLSS